MRHEIWHKVPQWHSFTIDGQVRVDMRHVCPKDVNTMLMKQARLTHWRKWAAKHEYEELKEGIWLEPALAMLRRRTKEGSWFWEEAGCRKDSSTLVGQMTANTKLVTQRKAQKRIRSH